MKKTFSILLTILLLNSSFALAQEDTDEVVDAQTETATAEESDTATEEAEQIVINGDENDVEESTQVNNEDGTIGLDDSDTTVTANNEDDSTSGTEKSENTGVLSSLNFLDNIDTMWLWVILGIGAVVLIGSLIGIFSLSKKEKKDKKKEIPETQEPGNTDIADDNKEDNKDLVQEVQEKPVINDIPEQPIQPEQTAQMETSMQEQQPEPVQVEEETSTPEITTEPSIKDALGDVQSYKQPEDVKQVDGDSIPDTSTIVSNDVPQTDMTKDLEDLNNASPNNVQMETQPSTIETASVSQLNSQPVGGLDMNNNMQQTVPVNDSTAPDIIQPAEDISTVIPQNQDNTSTDENLPNEGINQPIDTTNL